MAKGGGRRTYVRDGRGRFASSPGGGGGGGSSSRPKARMAQRGTNRLTRDNAGRITSVGGQGATARGGRLRTASGKARGAVVAKVGGKRAGTIGKPRGLQPGAIKAKPAAAPPKPAKASRSEMVVPALQGSKKLAPLSAQRRKIVERATARRQQLTEQSIKAREALQKAQEAAIPARNQYSGLSEKQRKTAMDRLAKAEAAMGRLDKRLATVGKARMFAEGRAGSTKQGYDRYDNAARRSDIGPQRKAAPAKPAKSVKLSSSQRAADPKQAGSIYNIPPSQLKRYRALTSAEYRQRREFRDQIDRSFSAYDKRDSQGMAKASKRSDVAFRRSERMRSTLRNLSGAGPEGKAPELPVIQYMRPRSKRDRKDQGYIVRENGRLSSNLYPKGVSGKGRRVDLVKMARIGGVVKAPKAKPAARPKAPTGPVQPRGRTRKQVAAAYRFKANQLGKETAARLGFSAALQRGQRGGVVDSAPRRIFRRGKNRQMTLTGGVETVRTGQMREVGRRNPAGKVTLTSRRRSRR